MTDWPAHVEPLDRAILDMLCEVPAKWVDWVEDEVTSTHEQALRLLCDAGLIEQRVRFEVQNAKLDASADVVIRVTGVLQLDALMAQLLTWLPGWTDRKGRLRGQTRLIVSDIVQVRLTEQGELARHDYQNQTEETPSAVLAFVKKTGCFAHRQDVEAKFVIEACDVSDKKTRRAERRMQNLAAAQANAQSNANVNAHATVGDITVNVNNDYEGLGSIFEKVLDRYVALQSDKSTKTSPVPPSGKPAKPIQSEKSSKPRKRGMSVTDANIKAVTILQERDWPGSLRAMAELVGCSHETLR